MTFENYSGYFTKPLDPHLKVGQSWQKLSKVGQNWQKLVKLCESLTVLKFVLNQFSIRWSYCDLKCKKILCHAA